MNIEESMYICTTIIHGLQDCPWIISDLKYMSKYFFIMPNKCLNKPDKKATNNDKIILKPISDNPHVLER